MKNRKNYDIGYIIGLVIGLIVLPFYKLTEALKRFLHIESPSGGNDK